MESTSYVDDAKDIGLIVVIGLVAYVVLQLSQGLGEFGSTVGDTATDVHQDVGEFYDDVDETTPDPYTTDETHPLDEGGQSATEFAIAETTAGTGIVAALLPDEDEVKETSQVGRERPYPNYDPEGFDPGLYGWERISRPNYTNPD
jgi:hypothetical protein